jgi:hypothetical protein
VSDITVIASYSASFPNYPEFPDTCHNAYNNQDISGSFWTVADDGVPRSGMHCNT